MGSTPVGIANFHAAEQICFAAFFVIRGIASQTGVSHSPSLPH